MANLNTVTGNIISPNSTLTTNLYSNTTFTLNTLDDIFQTYGPHVKKYQVFEITEDLLALSVTWHRLRKLHKSGGPYIGVTKLLDSELLSFITDQDRSVANQIRDYYSKKIMMWKLKGQALTKFREDMNIFVHSDCKVFQENMCPLAFRLPEFYEYDIAFDELSNNHNKRIIQRDTDKVRKQLTLQTTLFSGKSVNKRKEYWFTDENHNLVMLTCASDNPLLSLLDKYTVNPIMVDGLFSVRSRDDTDYFRIDKYSF